MTNKQVSNHSGIRALKAWIETIAQEQNAGFQLPVDRELAERFMVSRRSVARIMHECSRKGIVQRVKGNGTFVFSLTPKPAIKAPLSAPDSLATELLTAIRRGELKQGEPVPSVKYLAGRLRLSPATVSGAYRKLISEGHLYRIGKLAYVGPFSQALMPGQTGGIELFFADHTSLSTLYQPETFASVAFRKMEEILSAAGYNLQYRYLDELKERVAFWTATRIWPQGVILYRHLHSHIETWPDLNTLLHQKPPFPPLPVLVDLEWGLFGRRSAEIMAFSRNHVPKTIARALSSYLLRVNSDLLVLVVDSAFFREPAHLVSHLFPPTKIVAGVREQNPKMQCAIIFCDQAGPATLSVESMRVIAQKELSIFFPSDIVEMSVSSIRSYNGVAELLNGECAKLALVCQSDALASQILDECRTIGAVVPNRLSIISLENNPAFFHHGISSCVPDWEGVGYLMAHALIKDFPIPRTRKGFIQTMARMIHRQTTRPWP